VEYGSHLFDLSIHCVNEVGDECDDTASRKQGDGIEKKAEKSLREAGVDKFHDCTNLLSTGSDRLVCVKSKGTKQEPKYESVNAIVTSVLDNTEKCKENEASILHIAFQEFSVHH
jgi:hypothetical protein